MYKKKQNFIYIGLAKKKQSILIQKREYLYMKIKQNQYIVRINILIWKKSRKYLYIMFWNYIERRKAIYRRIKNKIYIESKRYINRTIIKWIFNLN